MKCAVEECDNTKTHGVYCPKHYKRWKRHGDPRYTKIDMGAGFYINNGYVMIRNEGKVQYEHILLAEKALGKPLPKGAIVHHTGLRHDNIGFMKLVICPDIAYHSLIHKRMKDLGYEDHKYKHDDA